MTCREIADVLADYVSGELGPDRLAAFERHLSLCPNCRAYIATYRATLTLSRHAFADLDAGAGTDVPEELVTAILSAVGR